MTLKFAFDEGLTGESKGGGNFPKVGHAYKATIREVEEKDNGWINIYLDGKNYTANKYDSFSIHENSTIINDFIFRIANNLIASNDSMKGAIGKKEMDTSKWSGKELEIGVVYGVATEWNGSEEVETKWATPKFSIPIDQVDDWKPDIDVYAAHQAKFWRDDSSVSQEPKKSAAQKPKSEPDPIPDDDLSDLPF